MQLLLLRTERIVTKLGSRVVTELEESFMPTGDARRVTLRGPETERLRRRSSIVLQGAARVLAEKPIVIAMKTQDQFKDPIRNHLKSAKRRSRKNCFEQIYTIGNGGMTR